MSKLQQLIDHLRVSDRDAGVQAVTTDQLLCAHAMVRYRIELPRGTVGRIHLREITSIVDGKRSEHYIFTPDHDDRVSFSLKTDNHAERFHIS